MLSNFTSRSGRALTTTAFCVLAGASAQSAFAQADTEILTNESVIQMVAGKLSKDLIIGKIGSTKPGFDLSSEGLIVLSNGKVDPKIVNSMVETAQSAVRRGSAGNAVKGLDEVLTNDIVVRMVTAKVPRPLILSKIQMSRSAYDISATGLVSLNTAKVPEEVIKAMMQPAPAVAVPVKAVPTKEAPAPPTKAPVKPPVKKPPPLRS